jgi:hypothetical protein
MPRISLREVFYLVAALAFAIVSLKYASPLWQALVGLSVMLAAVVALGAALFESGARRAFAIGFVVTVFCCALLIKFERSDKLPTTVFLSSLYSAMDTSSWVDSATGQEVPGFDAAKLNYAQQVVNKPTFQGRPMMFKSRLSDDNFFPIGHYWWALLFSFVGGRLAGYYYVRRTTRGPAGA